MARTQKLNLNITLESPQQFNAKKIANKKVMGVKVLSSSQQRKVYEGSDKITDAQGEIKGSQGQIDEST